MLLNKNTPGAGTAKPTSTECRRTTWDWKSYTGGRIGVGLQAAIVRGLQAALVRGLQAALVRGLKAALERGHQVAIVTRRQDAMGQAGQHVRLGVGMMTQPSESVDFSQ